MTDNEIIKALEEWSERGMTFCNVGMSEFARNILGLINRQRAENERLQSMNQAKLDTIHDIIARLEVSESEARKDFAAELKKGFTTIQIL